MNPWMTEKEITTIESHLDDSHVMFEWGCGGSTLRFSKSVNKYYSVEHVKE